MPELLYGIYFGTESIQSLFKYTQTYELMEIQRNDSQDLVFHGLG